MAPSKISTRSTTAGLAILDAMQDPHLFGPWFTPEAPWRPWRAFLAALFGLRMSPEETAIFRACTGRQMLPMAPAREGWVIVGRRGGKSLTAAFVSVWLACFRDYRPFLAPGERAVLLVVAADRAQARLVFSYISAFLDEIPLLRPLVARRTSEVIDLTNRVTIEVGTASFRTIRGRTLIGAVADELAFWRSDDSANPDSEIITAIRPGMATIPGALLLAISSPYSRRGELWRAHKEHFGRDHDPILVWQAPTRTMNPTVPESFLAEALAQDEAAARAEYLAEFRRDIETFISPEAVEAVVVPGRRELPPSGRRYAAFTDVSGGAQDAMTLAVAHAEGNRAILDCLREVRPPFSPEAVVEEFTAILRAYDIGSVTGDHYGGEWPRERFRVHRVEYRVADATKSDYYRDLVPLIMERRAELLDDRRLITQLCALEQTMSRVGKALISHPPGGHDDVANAAAGALVRAARTDVAMFEEYVEIGRHLAATGPLAEPRWWDCPRPGCDFGSLTADREPWCPRCRPKGPTLRDLDLTA
jgi:hypothetical protein